MMASTRIRPAAAQGRAWADLPDVLLLSIVLRLTHLSDFLSFSVVCRSWRTFLRSSSAVVRRLLSSLPPLLLLPNPYRFRSVDRRRASDSVIPGIKPRTLLDFPGSGDGDVVGLGYSHGHLIFQIIHETDPDDLVRLAICDPFSGRHISPPTPPPDNFPSSYYYAAVLSAPPDDKSCFLFIFSHTSIAYCRLLTSASDGRTENNNNPPSSYTVYPLQQNLAAFSGIVTFKNQQRVYAINWRATKLLEFSSNQGVSDDKWDIKDYGKVGGLSLGQDRAYHFDDFFFGPQLAELDGELLILLFVKRGNPEKTRDHFMDDDDGLVRLLQVYKMDFEEMRWSKADYVLDQYAVFVDTCGRCPVFVPKPEQWGGRCNCLYVVEQQGNTWKEFALDNARLIPEYGSPLLTLPEVKLPQ